MSPGKLYRDSLGFKLDRTNHANVPTAVAVRLNNTLIIFFVALLSALSTESLQSVVVPRHPQCTGTSKPGCFKFKLKAPHDPLRVPLPQLTRIQSTAGAGTNTGTASTPFPSYSTSPSKSGNAQQEEDDSYTVSYLDLERHFQECKRSTITEPAVLSAHRALHDNSTRLTPHLVSLVMQIYGYAELVDDVVDIVEMFHNSTRVVLNIVNYNTALTICKQHFRFEEAIYIYNNFMAPHISNTGTQVGSDAQVDSLPGSSGYSRRSNSRGTGTGNSNGYNPKGHRHSSNRFPAASAAAPDIITYSIIISCLCELGRWEEAHELFLRATPNAHSDERLVSPLLSGLRSCGQFESCLKIYETFKASRVQQSTSNNLAGRINQPAGTSMRIENTMMYVYGDMGLWENSLAVFRNLEVANATDEISVKTICIVLTQADQTALAEELQRKYRVRVDERDVRVKSPFSVSRNQTGAPSATGAGLHRTTLRVGSANSSEIATYSSNTPVSIQEKPSSGNSRGSEEDQINRFQLVNPGAQKSVEYRTLVATGKLPYSSNGNKPPIPIDLKALFAEAKRSGSYKTAVQAVRTFLKDPIYVWTPGCITLCISILGHAQHTDEALQVLVAMDNRDIPLVPQHYNAAMDACVRGRRYDKALELFHQMNDTSGGIIKDPFTYAILFKIYRGMDDWQAGYGVYQQIKSQPFVNTILLNSLVFLLGNSKQWLPMFEVFNDMVRQSKTPEYQSVKPDKYTVYTILDMLERAGQLDLKAFLAAAWTTSSTAAFIKGNRDHQASKEDRYGTKSFQGRHAVDCDSLQEVPLQVLEKFLVNMDVEKMPLPWQNEIDDTIIESSSNVTYSIGRNSPPTYKLLSTVEEVGKVVKDISQAGTLLDKLLENPTGDVIEVLSMGGRIDEAIELIDELQKQGKQAMPALYEAAIVACLPMGDVTRAMEVYSRMLEYSIPRRKKVYLALLTLLKENADETDFNEVFEEAKTQNIELGKDWDDILGLLQAAAEKEKRYTSMGKWNLNRTKSASTKGSLRMPPKL